MMSKWFTKETLDRGFINPKQTALGTPACYNCNSIVIIIFMEYVMSLQKPANPKTAVAVVSSTCLISFCLWPEVNE